MTRLAIQDQRLNLHDFLSFEMNAPADERWELIAGFMTRSMAGGTLAHNEIVQNIASKLREHFRRSRPECRVYTENARVDHDASATSSLPDIVVHCGGRRRDQTSITDPVAIVEVLSPSTEAIDRGPKWTAYQAIPSLAFHAVVDQRRILVEANVRDVGGWRRVELQARADIMAIPELAFAMTLDEVYEDVVELDGLG